MNSEQILIVITIAHTYADLGSLKDKIPFDDEYENAVNQHWQEIFDYLKSLEIDFSRARIYQDGLPDTLPEAVNKIISQVQTPNYEILRWLKERGALIMGTENPRLLWEEYQLIHAIADAPDESSRSTAKLMYLSTKGELTIGRDYYIAEKIKGTLQEGETGILFLGAGHHVSALLEDEITLTQPEVCRRAFPPELLSKIRGKERA